MFVIPERSTFSESIEIDFSGNIDGQTKMPLRNGISNSRCLRKVASTGLEVPSTPSLFAMSAVPLRLDPLNARGVGYPTYGSILPPVVLKVL